MTQGTTTKPSASAVLVSACSALIGQPTVVLSAMNLLAVDLGGSHASCALLSNGELIDSSGNRNL